MGKTIIRNGKERFVRLWNTDYYESELKDMTLPELEEIISKCEKSAYNFRKKKNNKAEYAIMKCLDWIRPIYNKKSLEVFSDEAKKYRIFYRLAEKRLFRFQFRKLDRLAEIEARNVVII